MDYSEIGGLILISGTAGLGIYCLSCAGHVWWQRNNRTPGRQKPLKRPLQVGRHAAVGLLILGAGGVLVSFIVQMAVSRQGNLQGRDLLTVRPRSDLRVASMTTEDRVDAGEVLVRFGSPQTKAEIETLALRRQKLRAQKKVLAGQPVSPDEEITRQLQQIVADGRHQLLSLGLGSDAELAEHLNNLIDELALSNNGLRNGDRHSSLQWGHRLIHVLQTIAGEPLRWRLDDCVDRLERSDARDYAITNPSAD